MTTSSAGNKPKQSAGGREDPREPTPRTQQKKHTRNGEGNSKKAGKRGGKSDKWGRKKGHTKLGKGGGTKGGPARGGEACTRAKKA